MNNNDDNHEQDNAGERQRYDHYGLAVYQTDEGTFAVGSEEEANAAARAYICDSLWAFKPDFICTFLARHDREVREEMSDPAFEEFKKSLGKLQSDLCESANPILKLMLRTYLDEFVSEAIEADGRGHFLASYDDEERDSDSIPGLPKGKGLLAYRIN